MHALAQCVMCMVYLFTPVSRTPVLCVPGVAVCNFMQVTSGWTGTPLCGWKREFGESLDLRLNAPYLPLLSPLCYMYSQPHT